MTASEKLRALDGLMPNPQTQWNRLSREEAGALALLSVALPLIADCIEEDAGVVDGVIWLDTNIHNYGSDAWRKYFKAMLRDARRAKAAHAALAEHLEGGDE